MGFRLALPRGSKATSLLVVVATGVAVGTLMRPGGGGTSGPSPSDARAASVVAAWRGVSTALDAYATFARSSVQDRPGGDAGLVVVRTSAQRSRGYLDAVEKARRSWDSATGTLPDRAGDGLPSASTASEAGGAVAAWVDAQRVQGTLVSTCLSSSTTLVAAQQCFRSRVDGETQAQWVAAAARVGKARTALEKELAAR